MSETTNTPQDEDGTEGTFVGGSFGPADTDQAPAALADLVEAAGTDGTDVESPGADQTDVENVDVEGTGGDAPSTERNEPV